MTEPTSAQDLFKGRRFDQEIIVLCVRWYLAFKLSSRDLVQMMAERGIGLAHTTILRWIQRYVPEFEKRWTIMRGRWAIRGGWTRLISRFGVNGSTCTAPWTKRVAPSIFS
jgi:transposase-like protein